MKMDQSESITHKIDQWDWKTTKVDRIWSGEGGRRGQYENGPIKIKYP